MTEPRECVVLRTRGSDCGSAHPVGSHYFFIICLRTSV